ncbi:ABC transporter permease [Legionella sp. 27cVA30]|uniref:ABC transporter permease n=1 Tax=Legionella sp. 27cVA30 TaxID=2905657 RepID=UPI0020A0885B|nr:ABC transporter permease [Legionella sp. 27cVA30]MCP0914818.1 ABC transporter permease [Legionella sp. 27cVA30]
MNHQRRAPWEVMFAAVFAIVIRDIQKKFITSVNTHRVFGFFWLVFEPISHIGIWIFIRTFLRSTHQTTMSAPLFVLLGAMPFLFFRNVVNFSKASIKNNKNFYIFRQIKPIDPIIAKLISELIVSILIFILILLGFSWFDVEWKLYNLSFWLINIVAFSLFLLGFALMLSVACFFFHFVQVLLGIAMRLVYLFCGVFFSAEMLPPSLREIMLYNPIFQFIELTRECFQPEYFTSYASSDYLIEVALIFLVLGLALYLTLRQKIMIEIEQR